MSKGVFQVAVVNSKGGAGKTTIATNLASYYSTQALKTCLIDFDSQGSSSFWVNRRPQQASAIQVISAYKQPPHVTNSWFLEPERGTQRVVIDTASGLDVVQFKKTLHESDAVIIPVLPSSIDIHAVAHFIADILLQGKFRREDGRLAVVANRARRNTLIYQQLEKFLHSLGIPFVATLRDTQQYIKASEAGLGLFDRPKQQRQDIESWQSLLDWLSQYEQKSQSASQLKIS